MIILTHADDSFLVFIDVQRKHILLIHGRKIYSPVR